jgi:hypothetical protein
VIEEDAAISWHKTDHPPKFTKLKEQVLPFINWLQEAEEESE